MTRVNTTDKRKYIKKYYPRRILNNVIKCTWILIILNPHYVSFKNFFKIKKDVAKETGRSSLSINEFIMTITLVLTLSQRHQTGKNLQCIKWVLSMLL